MMYKSHSLLTHYDPDQDEAADESFVSGYSESSIGNNET